MNKEVNEGRRSALKKLGLTTGAVYVAPAVTALVVPQHATATSSSSSSVTASTVAQASTGVFDVTFTLASAITPPSSATLVIDGIGGSFANITLAYDLFGSTSTSLHYVNSTSVGSGATSGTDTYTLTFNGQTFTGTLA